MGHTQNHENGKLAQKVIKESLNNFFRLLALIGNPFYTFLAFIIQIPLISFSLLKKELPKKTKKIKEDFNKLLKNFKNRQGVISSYFNNLFKKITKFNHKLFEDSIKIKDNVLKFISSFSDKLAKNFAKQAKKIFKSTNKELHLKKRGTIYYVHILKPKTLNILLFINSLKSSFSKLSFPKIKLHFALPKPKLSKIIFSLSVFFLLTISITGYAFWYFIIKDLPSPKDLETRKVNSSTKIYDRNGQLLYTIFQDENRTPISLSRIPPQVKLATLAIEDAGFYNHHGFSLKGIARAAITDIKGKEITGGSTITQQLVKNILLTPDKTLTRKLKEVVLAVETEKYFSKDKILEMYLNQVSYGGTAYGIEEASFTYFGKDVENLSLAEAALLAGLPKSPTQYSPFGSNPNLAIERQKEVLKLMESNGFISNEQRKEAEAEKLVFASDKTNIKAPHFVMYVRQQLEDKYGKELVAKGGLQVVTTLDLRVQKLAEEAVQQEVDKLKSFNVTNGAAIVLNPKTGEILAMVGSKDYFDTAHGGNVNVTLQLRPPGSSIKVINYAYALSHGYTPATILKDEPVTFIIPGSSPYTPKNYEGGFRGLLPLRNAFAESRNIPAVRVLASYGVQNMVDMGQKMGISTWENVSNYGLSLTLGGGDVKLLDLARVYSTVANYGQRPDITSILSVSNSNNQIIYKENCIKNTQNNESTASFSAVENNSGSSDCNNKQVLDPRIAYLITDILKDNKARSPSFGVNSLLVIPNHPEVAVKTGTSNDLRDNLAIGYTNDYLVAAWVGNNNNSPMSRIASGITGATPIFNKVMSAILTDKEAKGWNVPNGLVQLPICSTTASLACEGCSTKLEWFLEENKPTTACNINPENGTTNEVVLTNQKQDIITLNN